MRDYIATRFRLLKINALHSYQIDTAYFFNTWTELVSTLVYTMTYVLFISIVYGNVKEIAGYTHNDMLFLIFVGQLSYYLLSSWSIDNLKDFISSVNRGEFDLVLILPVPELFFTTFKRVYLLNLFRDSILPLLFVGSLVHWGDLAFSWPGLAAGAVIFICGQIAAHTIQFLLAIPVVWLGDAEQIFNINYSLTSSDLIPFEGMGTAVRTFLVTVLPVYLATSFVVSVTLGKTAIVPALVLAISVAIVCQIVRVSVWRAGLRAYSSASS